MSGRAKAGSAMTQIGWPGKTRSSHKKRGKDRIRSPMRCIWMTRMGFFTGYP
jgi:hypothetical protein